MSRWIKYTWNPCDQEAVCKFQSTVGAGKLQLDGTFADFLKQEVNFINSGFSRSVSLLSTVNNAGVTFTITGTQNGALVQEQYIGLVANTPVYLNTSFDIITSITVDGAVTNVAVGNGMLGASKIIASDEILTLPVDTFAVQTLWDPMQGWTPAVTMYITLDKIYQNGLTYGNLIDDGTMTKWNAWDSPGISENIMLFQQLFLIIDASDPAAQISFIYVEQ